MQADKATDSVRIGKHFQAGLWVVPGRLLRSPGDVFFFLGGTGLLLDPMGSGEDPKRFERESFGL